MAPLVLALSLTPLGNGLGMSRASRWVSVLLAAAIGSLTAVLSYLWRNR